MGGSHILGQVFFDFTDLTIESMTFTGVTGVNLIKMPDNLLDALSIQEGSNKYITFNTVNDEEDILFYKSVDILHTATHADDHALEIDTDAAGYGDVKALDVDYITGNITAGEDEGILLINIDRTLATGGDIFALEVLATDQVSGSTGIYGLKIGPEIGPIHQDSGEFIDPTLATDNHPSNHVSIMADGILANGTAIFTNNSEYIIIGADAAFQDMELIFSTVSSKDIRPTFWYSISGIDTFTQFTPVDGTDGCRHTGVISWDASDLSNHVADDTTTKFDIKIIRTKGGSFTTPVLGYAKTAGTTEYIWDKNGDVNIRNLSVAGTLGSGAFTITQNSDTLALSHDGSNAYVKWSDGDLTLMTDEGTNTDTHVSILGKGTGVGLLEVYDIDEDSYIILGWKGDDQPTITTDATPTEFNLLHDRAVDIKCWSSITSGNPYFYIYGRGTAANEYLRMRVESDNDALIEAEHDLNIIAAGGSISFGDENLSTTGTFGCAALTASGTVTIPTALTGLIRADSGVLSVDTDVTDVVSAASTTAQGKVELTIASEINTGTSTALAVTPDSLAGSYAGTKIVTIKVIDDGTALTTGDAKTHWTVPIELNGMDLVTVGAHVYTNSSSGTPTFQIHNLTDTSDMLSTVITIDINEPDSSTAGTPAVIDGTGDDVVTGDVIRFDCDVAGTGTKGMEIRMGFRLP